jgi:hypothetical protein
MRRIDAPGGNGSRSVVTSLDHAAFPAICASGAILCGARQKREANQIHEDRADFAILCGRLLPKDMDGGG